MRTGLGAIQQTLTAEAAGVFNQSIAEAGRRNHGQTTPLHVAATLLASPSGFLRQACIRSHPNSSHPLQCRALELCFSVALERLATAQSTSEPPPGTEPPVSNALLAALKRAQANQRRGGAEPQQQQPLLAVKVELDQLIISILDDPSVSRVMREAGFSSPAVKATIEQSIAKSNPHQYNSSTTPILLRLGNERRLGSPPVETMNPMKAFGQSTHVLSDIADAGQRSEFCPQCSENYERELVKLATVEKSLSKETRPSLPWWLESAKLNDDQRSQRKDIDRGILSDQKTRELQKKWRDTCLHLHPNFHQKIRCDRSLPPMLFMTTSYDSNLSARSMFFPPKLPPTKPLGQLNTNHSVLQHTLMCNSSPGSPVRTDLILGRNEAESTIGKVTEDLSDCIYSDILTMSFDKFSDDADTYKKLLKGLVDNAWWQAEAASAVALAITRWKSGNGKRRGMGSRGDMWLLFAGPDRVGKKKMASVLGEHVFGARPVMISLGTHRNDEVEEVKEEEANVNARGKTVIDRFVEVVRRNPCSVIVLEDVDETDGLVQGNIQLAIESGRITDTHGREVSLGNAVFVVLGDWSRADTEGSREGCYVDEMKLASTARGDWRLGFVVHERSSKRGASWLQDEHRLLKARKEIQLSNISLDLSLAPKDDDNTDGSDHNSSDVTVDHDDEVDPVRQQYTLTLVPHDLINNVDEFVVFKPVDFIFALEEIKKAISLKFSLIMDKNLSIIEVEDNVLEKILGRLWHDQITLNEWMDQVFAASLDQIKPQLESRDGIVSVVQLVMGPDLSKCNGDWGVVAQ